MFNETREVYRNDNKEIEFKFVGSNSPTTLIVKFKQADYSGGKNLLAAIRHLSRYINVTYHEGNIFNAYIIQFDYDLYHNENVDKLFESISSFVYDLEAQLTA